MERSNSFTPCRKVAWIQVSTWSGRQFLCHRMCNSCIGVGLGTILRRIKDSRHNFCETKSMIWCCRSFILMSSSSLSSSLSIFYFFWTFKLPTMAFICSMCFLCENLSEYEGFRPWQGFIFVEIFVIEF